MGEFHKNHILERWRKKCQANEKKEIVWNLMIGTFNAFKSISSSEQFTEGAI